VARAPDIAAKIEPEGSVLVGSTPAEFRELITVETARWQKVVREAGIKIED
jgi:tripartite-type tricarboxylate transporter receptor subunit TctC